jgi:hypothetical protein
MACGVGRHYRIGAALVRHELVSGYSILLRRLGRFRQKASAQKLAYKLSFFGCTLEGLPTVCSMG